MKQLVQEVKIHYGDPTDLNPFEDSLFHKNILMDVLGHFAGSLLLKGGDIDSCFTIQNVNYLFITAERKIKVALNGQVLLSTAQFTYLNSETLLTSISLHSDSPNNTLVKFVYGLIDPSFDGLLPSSESGSSWERILNDLLVDLTQ